MRATWGHLALLMALGGCGITPAVNTAVDAAPDPPPDAAPDARLPPTAVTFPGDEQRLAEHGTAPGEAFRSLCPPAQAVVDVAGATAVFGSTPMPVVSQLTGECAEAIPRH